MLTPSCESLEEPPEVEKFPVTDGARGELEVEPGPRGGSAIFRDRGLTVVGNGSCRCGLGPTPGAGSTKRSAIAAVAEGGDRGRLVRIGRLPGEPECSCEAEVVTDVDSRVRARVGVNSGPASSERKREERSDSSVSRWK